MTNLDVNTAICLDTNIIIAMALIENNIEELVRELKSDNTYDSLKQMLQKLKNYKECYLILPTVYEEIIKLNEGFGGILLNFIRNNNFYLVQIDVFQSYEYFNEVNKLIGLYTKELTEDDYSKIRQLDIIKNRIYPKRAFKLIKRNDITGPVRDARILAEATILGLPFVTNNTFDFFHNGKKFIINYLNMLEGYKSNLFFTSNEHIRKFSTKRKISLKEVPMLKKYAVPTLEFFR